MTKINVVDDSYTEITDEADPEDSWSRESTAESHYIRGIKIGDRYGDVECSFEVVPMTNYYLLYYRYSTGDTFGRDEGKIEFVALYNDIELADKSAQAMNNAANNKQMLATIWNDEGKPYEEYLNCVTDYFGSFDGAEVETVQLI
jgi:hypothetical protein